VTRRPRRRPAAARTGLADESTHISERHARVDDLAISICAVLLAEACNTGLEPLARRDIPAPTRGRLLWVQQNCLRAETILRSIARLAGIAARGRLPHRRPPVRLRARRW
jgi:Tn3 transposase DDE domain